MSIYKKLKTFIVDVCGVIRNKIRCMQACKNKQNKSYGVFENRLFGQNPTIFCMILTILPFLSQIKEISARRVNFFKIQYAILRPFRWRQSCFDPSLVYRRLNKSHIIQFWYPYISNPEIQILDFEANALKKSNFSKISKVHFEALGSIFEPFRPFFRSFRPRIMSK